MLTYKALQQEVKKFFISKLPNINVEFGKYGEFPGIITPQLLMYVEPVIRSRNAERNEPIERYAKFNLFGCCSGCTPDEAASDAIELLEDVEKLLVNYSDETLTLEHYLNSLDDQASEGLSYIQYPENGGPVFDAFYSDVAVANMEIFISYVRH